jgi:hypothetical protein
MSEAVTVSSGHGLLTYSTIYAAPVLFSGAFGGLIDHNVFHNSQYVEALSSYDVDVTNNTYQQHVMTALNPAVTATVISVYGGTRGINVDSFFISVFTNNILVDTNTASGGYNCGVEFVGQNQNTTVTRNAFSDWDNCAIGGWYGAQITANGDVAVELRIGEASLA